VKLQVENLTEMCCRRGHLGELLQLSLPRPACSGISTRRRICRTFSTRTSSTRPRLSTDWNFRGVCDTSHHGCRSNLTPTAPTSNGRLLDGLIGIRNVAIELASYAQP